MAQFIHLKGGRKNWGKPQIKSLHSDAANWEMGTGTMIIISEHKQDIYHWLGEHSLHKIFLPGGANVIFGEYSKVKGQKAKMSSALSARDQGFGQSISPNITTKNAVAQKTWTAANWVADPVSGLVEALVVLSPLAKKQYYLALTVRKPGDLLSGVNQEWKLIQSWGNQTTIVLGVLQKPYEYKVLKKLSNQSVPAKKASTWEKILTSKAYRKSLNRY